MLDDAVPVGVGQGAPDEDAAADLAAEDFAAALLLHEDAELLELQHSRVDAGSGRRRWWWGRIWKDEKGQGIIALGYDQPLVCMWSILARQNRRSYTVYIRSLQYMNIIWNRES